ncbi:MAG: hypothetical protein A3J83_04805 [Elusimicrobia bacterium RIFOXYA2_FULL_40_6]|nr:MAG: hypothetical protein A3J83_04805 [Elusimicrobia bacterium RIFOXYA2_FULL_40_6]
MRKRNPLGFLFFTNELKIWYFKYVVGAILVSMSVAGLAVYFTIGKYAETVSALGLTLPGTTSAPLNIAKDMLLSVQSQMIYILMFETVVLVLVGIVASLYFAYRVVGPIKRLEREINQMAEGAAEIHPVTLRDGDYLAPLTILMNKLIEIIGKKQETIDDFKASLKGLSSFVKENK